jgi:predicted transcriptional regulator
MTPKTFIALAALTLATTIGATATVLMQSSTGPVAYIDEPAFPELRAKPDAVMRVTIMTKDGAITLNRTSPETWIAPDAFDYPAANEKINRLVRQLNDMRLIEAKTAKAERFARLEVEDVTEEAKSRLIRLEDASGKVLAEALIGKRLFRLTGDANSGTYIRRPGEDQSWLASGGFDLDPEVEAWLDQIVVEIDRNDVARVEIALAGEESYSVSRETSEDALTIEGLADGETLKEGANLAELASAMTSVRLASVKKATDVAWPEERQVVKLWTFDGLELTMQIALIDDKPWATVAAAPAELPDDAARADQVRQRIEVINATTASWAYEVNQSLYQRLTKPRTSWIEASDGTS